MTASLTRTVAPGSDDAPTDDDLVETADMTDAPRTAYDWFGALELRGFCTSENWTCAALRILYAAGYMRPADEGSETEWARTARQGTRVRGKTLVVVAAPKPKAKRQKGRRGATEAAAPVRLDVRLTGDYAYVWCRKCEGWIELSAHRHRECDCGADVDVFEPIEDETDIEALDDTEDGTND